MTTPLVPSRVARGFGDLAVTHHELATQAALDLLGRGGNAVEAAVAANAVVGVVLPTACGPGGDLFALVHRSGAGAPTVLNASGRAGSGVDPDRLRDRGHRRVPLRGADPITVPGCVDGWLALLEAHGSLPLAEVLAPAVRLAREGFPASEELSRSLEAVRPLVGDQPSAGPLYPKGRPPRPGARLTRPDLAATLEELASGGREAFYGGRVGRAVVEVTEGRITEEDLARSCAEWVEPLGLELFGRTAWTVPPNSQGYLTLASAWLVERLDPPRDPDHPSYVHALVEAARAVAWERDDLVADPRSAPLPPSELLDPDRLSPRLERITDRERASWPSSSDAPGGTTYLCVVDRDGLAVSLIQSNFAGIGSGRSAGDTGVFLQNRGAGFDLRPGHPNELGPGKRPLHTLSPTLWTRAGRTELLLGTRGGYQQPQLLLQVAAHLLHLEADPGTAQAIPRWILEEETVRVEDRMTPEVVEGLEERGHRVERAGEFEMGWGPVSLITIGEDGLRTGAADPRVGTARAAGR